MRPNYLKLIFAILLSVYFLSIAYDPMQGSFFDNVDLPIHEFGHLLFRPFGEFMMVAGGSLFQVIMPLIFFGYFFWKRQFYSEAIVSLWVGQSIFNVYVYAADAVVMQLVLTSGFTGSEHSIVAYYVALDLLEEGAGEKLFVETVKHGFEVDWLINNAGFGSMGDFAVLDLEKELDIIRLNISALVGLTPRFLPQMRDRRR